MNKQIFAVIGGDGNIRFHIRQVSEKQMENIEQLLNMNSDELYQQLIPSKKSINQLKKAIKFMEK
jgi:hypothetical protein